MAVIDDPKSKRKSVNDFLESLTLPEDKTLPLIMEIFFDGDRNDPLRRGVTQPLWRILLWETESGEREIDPDSEYHEPLNGEPMHFVQAELVARRIAVSMRKNKWTVYKAPIIPAYVVVDKHTQNGHPEKEFKISGGAKSWEEKESYNLEY